jgi:hypothetical protein
VSWFSAGTIAGIVTLKPVLKRGKSIPARRIRFTAKILPDASLEPPSVQVGGRHLGDSFEEVVVLRSLTGRMITNVRAEAHGAGLSVEKLRESGPFRITQRVCGLGTQTNEIRFSAEIAGRSFTVQLPVSYTGVQVEED